MKVPLLLLFATLGTVHSAESSYSIVHDRGVRSYFSTPFGHGKSAGFGGGGGGFFG